MICAISQKRGLKKTDEWEMSQKKPGSYTAENQRCHKRGRKKSAAAAPKQPWQSDMV